MYQGYRVSYSDTIAVWDRPGHIRILFSNTKNRNWENELSFLACLSMFGIYFHAILMLPVNIVTIKMKINIYINRSFPITRL